MNTINNAIDYVNRHGLDASRCHLIIGTLTDGRRVYFTDKPGAVRWIVDRDFERDGGIFSNFTLAQVALAQYRVLYKDCDANIDDIRIDPLL